MFCVSVLLGMYFFILTLFSLVSHPVYYCGFLVVNSLISSLICYYIFGFSWYSLIFCLIYIGGVAFIHLPMNSYYLSWSLLPGVALALSIYVYMEVALLWF